MTTGWADAAALRRDLDDARGRIAALEQQLTDARRGEPPRRHAEAIRRATSWGERLARDLLAAGRPTPCRDVTREPTG
jgi:hypothetical protein